MLARVSADKGYENLLLYIAGAFIVINLIALTLIEPSRWSEHLLVFAIWSGCAIGGQHILYKYLPNANKLLFPIVMTLSGWGIVIITRIDPIWQSHFGTKQSVWLVISLSAMLFTALSPRPLYWLRAYRYLWLVGGLTLLLATIQLGSNPSGQAGSPQLWLGLGGVFFQPSEALKIILVAFLASYLAEQYPSLRAKNLIQGNQVLALSPRIVGPILLMWGLSVVILIWQRDLGTAVLFFAVFLILLYVASSYTFILIGGGILIIIASFLAYNLFSVVQLRIDIWLNPWSEADGRAFQLVQSLQAFAAGGIFGQGIGQGSPIHIPVVHSDFIFSALAEEYGLLGISLVLTCVALIIIQGFQIAIQQKGHAFHSLFAIGLSTLIAVQSILIMGGVIRFLPLTGVTLPFLSYGGSSLLMSFIMIGLLLRLSAET